MRLTVAKIDRYDMINNPMSDKPSVTIWFTGCHFKCNGCQNPQLQDKEFGESYECSELYNIVREMCDKYNIDDIVLLGGEPLDQDTFAIEWFMHMICDDGLRIWLYTGYNWNTLPVKSIRDACYTIKCGIYDETKRNEGSFPITSNQTIYRMVDGCWQQIKLNEEEN